VVPHWGELDIADPDEVVIAGRFAKGTIEHLRRTQMIALIQFVKCLNHAARRIQQTFAIGVLSDIAEQGVNGLLGLGARRRGRSARTAAELGRVELGRAGFRGHIGRFDFGRLQVRRLAWAEGFDQCVHVFSVRPATRAGVSPGRRGGMAAGRLSPIHNT
jgi:hypothetical protein